jgi:hypothetical protein
MIADSAIKAAGHPRVAMRMKSFDSNWPLAYTIELAGVPITSQYAIDVAMARPTPTSTGFVPELTAMSRTTGPITATVAPALIKFVNTAPMKHIRITNPTPEFNPSGETIIIIWSANQLDAPVTLKTVPRLMHPA